VLPEFSSRHVRKETGRGEESINVRQSAKQLDVQKNVLPNGFDSSTENRAVLSPSFQKSEVAPFLVKKPDEAAPQANFMPI